MTTVPMTQGSLRDLFHCEELYRLKRLALMRKPGAPAPALLTGSAFHHGVEQRSARDGAEKYLRDHSADWLDGDDLWTVEVGAAEVYAMVEAALDRWGDDWPARQEVEFCLPLRNPATGRRSTRHEYRGVIDGFPDGPGESPEWLDTVGEWKTARSPSRAYFDRLRIDWQVSAYCEAASRMTGRPVRRVRYRVITKPGCSPRGGESAGDYARRVAARPPLASLKPRFLKSAPKGCTVDRGVLVHRDAEFVHGTRDGVQGWVERDCSIEAREAAREAARLPLERRPRDTPREHLKRCREWYRSRPYAVTEEVLTRTEDQMARWRAEAWSLHLRAMDVERAHAAAERGEHVARLPIRNDSRCLLYGRRCDFLDLCSGLVGPEAYEVIDNPHPELDGVPPTVEKKR